MSAHAKGTLERMSKSSRKCRHKRREKLEFSPFLKILEARGERGLSLANSTSVQAGQQRLSHTGRRACAHIVTSAQAHPPAHTHTHTHAHGHGQRGRTPRAVQSLELRSYKVLPCPVQQIVGPDSNLLLPTTGKHPPKLGHSV